MTRGTSTTSWTVHSQNGYKTFGYLKSARTFAKAEANRTGVSVGIYQNGGRGTSYTIRPKKQSNKGSFQIVVPRGTLKNPSKRRSLISKIRKILSNPGGVALDILDPMMAAGYATSGAKGLTSLYGGGRKRKRKGRGNPAMRQWKVDIPPTQDMGSYRYGYVDKTAADAKRRALSDYQLEQRRYGVKLRHSLPKGTKVILVS